MRKTILEEIEEREKKAEIKREKDSQSNLRFFITMCAIVVVLSLMLLLFLIESIRNNPIIQKDGTITRTYDQLLPYLDEQPNDFLESRYESHIPSIIQEDIERMMNSEKDISIKYANNDIEYYIEISKSEDSPTGIEVTILNANEYATYRCVTDHISFYKNKDCINVYGTWLGRDLDGYSVNAKTSEFDFMSLDTTVDLPGVKDEFDIVRSFSKNATLCKSGNEFMLYRYGEKLGETVTFPGGEIVDFTYYYILDDQNDLYYLYYCTSTEDPWIHFSLVDKNISQIDADEFSFNNFLRTEGGLKYPCYEKNGKRYAGITNYNLERSYGQNFGIYNDEVAPTNIDFKVTVVEISKPLASRIVIRCGKQSSSSDYDWFIRYYYNANDQELYEEERINGLDAEISTKLSDADIAEFDGKEVTIEQISDVISQLKQVYARYEDEARYYE